MCRSICKAVGVVVVVCALIVLLKPPPSRLRPLASCSDFTAPPGRVHLPAGREFDVVVHGSTGFTGELTARYLGTLKSGTNYAIAGRSKGKLDALLATIEAEVAKAGSGRAPAAAIIADAGNLDELKAMARRTKVVLAAAGPYAKYGTLLAQACAEEGTHYADLSGEMWWQRRTLDSFHDVAARSGAKIVLAAGYDSVPFDLGVQLALHALAPTVDDTVSVTAGVLGMRGAVSGGTIASGLGQQEEIATGKTPAAWDDDPYLLVPGVNASCRTDHYPTGWGPWPRWDHTLGAVAVPHFMAPINARIIRRSMALLGQKDVAYAEGMTAGAMFDAIRFTLPYLINGELKLIPSPGEGPPVSMQMAGGYEAVVVAADRKGRRAEVQLAGRGEPGYRHTSKIFAEVGLCLADSSCHRSASGGGVLTSMSALDRDALRRRLAEATHEDGQPLLTYVATTGDAAGGEL